MILCLFCGLVAHNFLNGFIALLERLIYWLETLAEADKRFIAYYEQRVAFWQSQGCHKQQAKLYAIQELSRRCRHED